MNYEITEKDKAKLRLIESCKELSTAKQLAVRVGISEKTVRIYLDELRDHVLKVTNTTPWLYLTNPNKTYIPKRKMTAREIRRQKYRESIQAEPEKLPVAKSKTLSTLGGYDYYIPVLGKEVPEKHAGWIGRKESPHIGCGSQAHVDMG